MSIPVTAPGADDWRRELGERGHSVSEPLYLLNRPFEGHSAQTENATVTYVRYQGGCYAVTCAHVADAADGPAGCKRALALCANGLPARRWEFNAIDDLDDFGELGFIPLRSDKNPGGPDIALARLPERFANIHMAPKRKSFIELDEWRPAARCAGDIAVALGYPTAHKAASGGVVSAAQLLVAAWLTSDTSLGDVFSLQAELDEETSFGMSGMSGGPIFHVNVQDGTFTPLGITFEGTPSDPLPGIGHPRARRSAGQVEAALRGNKISLFGRRILYARGYALNPKNFANWLEIFNRTIAQLT